MYYTLISIKRYQVTVEDVAKYEPVMRAGVRNHNDVRKEYETISQEAFHKYSNPEHQASQKVCKAVFQVKVIFL